MKLLTANICLIEFILIEENRKVNIDGNRYECPACLCLFFGSIMCFYTYNGCKSITVTALKELCKKKFMTWTQ